MPWDRDTYIIKIRAEVDEESFKNTLEIVHKLKRIKEDSNQFFFFSGWVVGTIITFFAWWLR